MTFSLFFSNPVLLSRQSTAIADEVGSLIAGNSHVARGAQANKSLLATCEITCEGNNMIGILAGSFYLDD